jgi:2-oxoglutarate ferredoxin oxidoreductase subunit beta
MISEHAGGESLKSGSYACAEGAIAAGCRFYADNPITSSSEIAAHMAKRLSQVGGHFLQMEDEIGSIAATLGASKGGLKSMTAISGPGAFPTIHENIALAMKTGTPCVLVNIQSTRTGSGVSSLVGQGEDTKAKLTFQGGYQTIAYAPNSVQEMFDLTVKAFNMAEKYRKPTFVMVDQVVTNMRESLAIPGPKDIETVQRRTAVGKNPDSSPFDFIEDLPPIALARKNHPLKVDTLTRDWRGNFPANHGVEIAERHPLDEILRAERLPLIWCPGCGLGIVTKCLAESIVRSGIPLTKHVVVAGTGCTSPLLSYLSLETYRTALGGAVPFAMGLKSANPELEVTVVAGDGDLLSMGDSHLIHAVSRNVDINVFCVNNFDYGMTGGQCASITPRGTRTETTPYGSLDASFNLPYVVAAAGGPFVSRWTTIHVRQLLKAMERAFQVQGLAFVEIISPCPPGFSESRNFEDGYAQMEYFRNCSRVDDNADLREIRLSMGPPEPIVVGNFVDQRKATFHELGNALIEKAKGPAK